MSLETIILRVNPQEHCGETYEESHKEAETIRKRIVPVFLVVEYSVEARMLLVQIHSGSTPGNCTLEVPRSGATDREGLRPIKH